MGKKKNQNEINNNESILDDSDNLFENTESNQVFNEVDVKNKHAKIPQIIKGIPQGKITFDIFFAYGIKKFPDQIKVDHYRAMKNYLKQKNNAMIDTKDGFCESFKSYGLNIA